MEMETWIGADRLPGGAYSIEGHLNDDQVAALVAARPASFKVGADSFRIAVSAWRDLIYVNVYQGRKVVYVSHFRKNQYGIWFAVEAAYCGFRADKFMRLLVEFIRTATGCGDGNDLEI